LSTWRILITHCEESRESQNSYMKTNVFIIDVHRIDSIQAIENSEEEKAHWTVAR